jgi:hypothetical protein
VAEEEERAEELVVRTEQLLVVMEWASGLAEEEDVMWQVKGLPPNPVEMVLQVP